MKLKLTILALLLVLSSLAAPSVRVSLIALFQIAGGSSGNVPVSNGTSLVSRTLSGDATVGSTGIVNVAKANGNSFPASVASGDLLYGSGASALSKLGVGSTGNVLTVSGGLPSWAAPAFSGTVTSVGLTVPSWLSVSGSPITSSGTLAVTATSGQTANSVLATPDGTTGALSVRSLVAGDIPSLDAAKITTGTMATARLGSGSASSSTFLRGDSTWAAASGGSGTVTSVSSGNFSPLFNVSVATSTTTPAFSYAAITQSQNLGFFGPSSGSAAAPTFRAMVPLDWAGTVATGSLPYASSATVNSWLGIGSSNQVLTVVSGVPAWATMTGNVSGSANQTPYFSGTNTLAASSVLTNNNATLTANPAASNIGLTINGVSGAKGLFVNAPTGGATTPAIDVLNDSVGGIFVTSTVAHGAAAGGAVGIWTSTNPTAAGDRHGTIFFGKNLSGTATAFSQIQSYAEEDNTTNKGAKLVFNMGVTGTTSSSNRVEMRGNGDVCLQASGAESATSTTKGFVFLGTVNGIPTGTPDNSYTGAKPVVIDRADGRLYYWDGSAWTNLSAAGDTVQQNGTGPITVTASQLPGLFTNSSGISTLTYTLPASSACKGKQITFATGAAAGSTINRAGSDVIIGAGSLTATSVSVTGGGHSITLEADGGTGWYIKGTS